MGRLVVVRHAKSDYPWGVSDHDRPLNERGRRDAPELGRWLDAHLTWTQSPPLVLVSTARRAQLTWWLARSSMGERWVSADIRDEARIYEAAVPTLVSVVAEAVSGPAAPDLVILVGHNPGLAGLVHTCAAPGDLRDEATSKFPTSAVAILACDGALDRALQSTAGFEVEAFAVPRG